MLYAFILGGLKAVWKGTQQVRRYRVALGVL